MSPMNSYNNPCDYEYDKIWSNAYQIMQINTIHKLCYYFCRLARVYIKFVTAVIIYNVSLNFMHDDKIEMAYSLDVYVLLIIAQF